VIHALATVRPYRAHTVTAERVVLDELKVLLCADQWARVTRQGDDGKSAEHGIDGAPLEAELAQVGPVQERSRGIEKVPGRWMAATCGSWLGLLGRSLLRSGLRFLLHIEPELVRIHPSRHQGTVTDMSPMRGAHQTRTMRA
jgi:hypothetical protein